MPAAAAKSKKTGKENALPAKTKAAVEVEADDSFGDMSMEEIPSRAKSAKPAAKGSKPKKADVDEEEDDEPAPTAGPSKDLERKLASMTAERDRLRKHRDEVSKQFEDLTRLRNTETEKLLQRYKESAEVAAKAQSDIITNLTALNEKLTGRITGLEKSLAAAPKHTTSPSPAADPVAPAPAPQASTSTLSKSEQKELKALRDEVLKLRSSTKEKDAKITQLEQEYQAEVANSLSLQRSTRGAPSASAQPAQSTEDSEKDQISLGFYEDMTELSILDVKVKRDPKAGKEATLNCLHTNQENSRTLQFKLRSYQEVSQELVQQKADNPWVRMVHYQPESLASETDKEFVKRLGVFAEGFSIERKQLGQMWDELRSKVAGEEEDEDDE